MSKIKRHKHKDTNKYKFIERIWIDMDNTNITEVDGILFGIYKSKQFTVEEEHKAFANVKK